MNNRFQAQLTARLALDKMRARGALRERGDPGGLILVGHPHAAVVLQDRAAARSPGAARNVSTNSYALYRVVGSTLHGRRDVGGLPPDLVHRHDLQRRALHLHPTPAQSSTSPREAAASTSRSTSKLVEDRRALRADGRHRAPQQHALLGKCLVRGTRGRRIEADPSIMRRWLRLPCVLKCERGMALVMAIGITTRASRSPGTTAIAYSTSSSHRSPAQTRLEADARSRWRRPASTT